MKNPPGTMALEIDPPLLNSACPWATTYEDLKALYDSPFTGAVTTRTSLVGGFNHDENVHQFCFFDSGAAATAHGPSSAQRGPAVRQSSLNTLGYSPIALPHYLQMVERVVYGDGGADGDGDGGDGPANGAPVDGDDDGGTAEQLNLNLNQKQAPAQTKPFIVSVTGSPEEVAEAYGLIGEAMGEKGGRLKLKLAMEINLSCPNIKGKPPPAYHAKSLDEYLALILQHKKAATSRAPAPLPPVGIKLPPYTYVGQFEELVGALAGAKVDDGGGGGGKSVVDFVTSTNTLGSSLVLDGALDPVLASESGTGIGGLAGAALHPLALGNVATLRRLLDAREATKHVMLIGVGGVDDRAGFDRMRSVGAAAVAVATALGREGVGVFAKISAGKG